MTRYFERFYHGDSMNELSELAAVERGTYAVQEDGPLRRYRGILDKHLKRVMYVNWTSPTQPIADALQRNEGVPIEVYSPVEATSHGGHRYRTWYIQPDGRVQTIMDFEFEADGKLLRQSLIDDKGELVSYSVRHYDKDGWLIEIVSYARDGTITGRQDA